MKSKTCFYRGCNERARFLVEYRYHNNPNSKLHSKWVCPDCLPTILKWLIHHNTKYKLYEDEMEKVIFT